jgi:hypothetical protein
MPLRTLHFDSAIRGVFESPVEALDALYQACKDKMAECGLAANLAKAATAVPKHGRGPEKGQAKGSSNFNGRSILGWIESVPVTPAGQTPDIEVAAAYANLIALHATLAKRLA